MSVVYQTYKIFLVLNPFFAWIRIRIVFAWIRIRNEFFKILDPDPYPPQSAYLYIHMYWIIICKTLCYENWVSTAPVYHSTSIQSYWTAKKNKFTLTYLCIYTVYIHPYLFISLFIVSIRVRKSSTLACFFFFINIAVK